jgi:hypothetical protein
MEPQIPSRASEGRRHVCLTGIRQGLRPLRTPVHVCQCAGIRVHAIDWRDSRRGFPLPKGNRDADERRLNALSLELNLNGLKTIKEFDNVHFAQCLNYLKITGLKLCLIINFSKPRVEI